MSRRFASFFVLLAACTPGPGDFEHGAPSPNTQTNAEGEAPIQLGLPDSFVKEVSEDVAEAPETATGDTGPADTGNNCANDIMVGGNLVCL